MSNKIFISVLAIIILGFVGLVMFDKKSEPAEAQRPGIEQPNKGQKHVSEGSVQYGGPEPPTSGDHASPLPWQIYDQEIADVNVIHNLEHGGIYVSYRPDLPQEQIDKIKALFGQPYSRKDFQPTKVIVAPRAANDSPIIMSSWTRNMKLDSFNEEKMVEYYLRNFGKSPEPSAP